MKISWLCIRNFRNIKNIHIKLGSVVTIIGENNSGKSNFLRALTLPFLADDVGYMGKTLSWEDINDEAKEEYYGYLLANKDAIISENIALNDFLRVLPVVSVEVMLCPEATEKYYVKDLSYDVNNDGDIMYGFRYEYLPNPIHAKKIFDRIKAILSIEEITSESIEQMKMNLLPTELYTYTINIPQKGSLPYDVLKLFRYTALAAERDDFSTSSEKLGSKSLVKLLQMKLSDQNKLLVEKEYSRFFETIKNLSGMDRIINWQETTELQNASEFFENISILPNMPTMSSILNSIRLGYAGNNLSAQGLGQRNLILLLVLLNSLVDKKDDVALDVLTMEEPEAHLCINNIRLMVSFIKAFTEQNSFVQLFYSTHSTEFVSKLGLENTIIMSTGNAYALKTELNNEEISYLSKNPNTDLYKLFLSKRCILVEGLSEELLIRAYLESKQELNDIEVISFHKGFTNIIEIWIKMHSSTNHKLGIVRDFDNQSNAQTNHERYNKYENICVSTTKEYTLEPEIVSTGENFSILQSKYGELFGWTNLNREELADKWKSSKASVMLEVCRDLAFGSLPGFEMPKHIQDILDFFG